MKRVFLMQFLLLLLVFGCKKDNDDMPEDLTIEEDPTTTITTDPSIGNIEEMEVPDGFNFQTERAVQFDLTTVDSTQTQQGAIKLRIYGLKDDGQRDELFSGVTNPQGLLNITLNISIHFEKILIVTNHQGSIFQNEFSIDDNIIASLKFNGNLQDDTAETRANNCYPSVNSTFTSDNKGMNLSSDQKMKTITIFYTDGSTETIQVNAKTFAF